MSSTAMASFPVLSMMEVKSYFIAFLLYAAGWEKGGILCIAVYPRMKRMNEFYYTFVIDTYQL